METASRTKGIAQNEIQANTIPAWRLALSRNAACEPEAAPRAIIITTDQPPTTETHRSERQPR